MLSLLDDTVTGGAGIPFTDKLLNSGKMGGKTAGGGGKPAKTAGSGLNWKLSGEGIVNIGTFPGAVVLGMAPVPKNGAASLVIEGGM